MGRNSKSEEARTGVDRWNATEAPKAKKPRKTSRKPRLRGDARKYVGTLIAMAVLCVVCIIGFTPLSQRITQGLDIQGGVSVILTASKSDGSTVSSSDMDTAKSIVEKRVNALGSSEATVQLQGSNSILVQIPGATDADATVQTIGQTGHLEFVRLDDIGDAEALAKIAAGTEDVELQDGTYTAFMDGSYIVSSTVESSTTDVGTYAVNVTFNSDGAQIFSDVSPDMHWAFAVEHDLRWLTRWGLTYYGCCEPLDGKIDMLRRIPNLRKISVSPWCNPERAVNEIGRDYVISHKPNPAILAETQWDPVQARKNIRAFLDEAGGQCHVELIMKDVSTVRYHPQRLWEWTALAMEEAER